jgi:hypothetical protein
MAAVLEIPREALETYEPQARLIADTGTRLLTREELALLPLPEATRTFKPVSHHELAAAIIECLGFRHLHVVKDEYAVSHDGARMFGIMEIDVEWSNLRFAIALRNGNDRSMRLAITCGYRVFVCSNMAFRGDYYPTRSRNGAPGPSPTTAPGSSSTRRSSRRGCPSQAGCSKTFTSSTSSRGTRSSGPARSGACLTLSPPPSSCSTR